jgi:hypothetical protein
MSGASPCLKIIFIKKVILFSNMSQRLFATVLLCSAIVSLANAQPDTTDRSRRADSIRTFFIGTWSDFFDNWSQAQKEQHFGVIGPQDPPHRYTNLPDIPGFNMDIRRFWDYPTATYPAPRDTVLGGTVAPSLDVLGIEPVQLHTAFDNAQYARFEMERHDRQSSPTEYLGFLYRPGLTGKNMIAKGATSPAFLIGTARQTDTNAVALGRSDVAGIFADDMWHPDLYLVNSDLHANFFRWERSRKMKVRVRVKITESLTNRDANKIVFILTRTEKNERDDIRGISRDTIRARRFKHSYTGFDTIDIPFIRDPSDRLDDKVDSSFKMYFSFYWPKQVNAIFDYMELMTAHIDRSDSELEVQVGWNQFGTDRIAQGWASAFSAEDFLAPNPVELGKLVSRIKHQYLGRVNYVRIGDEFPFGFGLPFKRLVKLMRDSTADSLSRRKGMGRIEIVPFTVDSGTGWFGKSLPNAHEFNFEGARKGWVDTNLYADPKMIFFDPYKVEGKFPLPKRTINAENLTHWENASMPSIYNNHYSREAYLKMAQYTEFREYLEANRIDRRWTERQGNHTKYAICWQAGAHPMIIRDDLPATPDTFAFTQLRPPTGPEMKVTGHLATSCGSAGLMLYLLLNPGASGEGPNGGVMKNDGTHDSMYFTLFTGDRGKRIWMGFKERYDTVQKLIPILKQYGTVLMEAKRIGDWTAAELPHLDSSIASSMPFVNSITAFDDLFVPDRLSMDLANGKPDSSNRTFVHVSEWIDTVGGKADTLLYITNMRTDDSYGVTEVPSTIDRRYVTLKLKRQHYVVDMMQPNVLPRMNSKLRTPFVGTPNGYTLNVRLLPGDGILVKLL